MTRSYFLLRTSFTLSLIALMVSCNKDDAHTIQVTSQVAFGYTATDHPSGKILSSGNPSKVRISIANTNEDLIYNESILDLFSFGDGYVSESIELPLGEYELTLFQILNEEEEVIMASPLEGSEKAEEVVHPLPIQFEVSDQETTKVTPEVLIIQNDESPALFGYVQFDFELINTFSIDLSIVSDWDSTAVQTAIQFIAYSSDSIPFNEKVHYYESGIEKVVLPDASAHFYELMIDVPQTYHATKYYFLTEYLQSMDALNLYLSPTESTNKYTLNEPLDNFENEINVFIPKDGCLSYSRVAMTGSSHFYSFLSYTVMDQETKQSLLPSNFMESFSNDPVDIIYPSPSTQLVEAENICNQINDLFPEKEGFETEVFVVVDTGVDFLFSVFTWDTTTSLWTREN